MKKLSWPIALAVLLIFFGVYSFRLGIEPEFRHDDYEYTYPSFSLAQRGNFGSPLLGPGLNVENRTYNLTVYYYAAVHAALIRLFGDGPESIPLANTLHFALLAAAGAFFLVRRGTYLGLLVFLYALTSDERMVAAARHGRPEMTAGFCLMVGVLALWLRLGEGRRGPFVLLGMSAAFVAGMLSHSSVLFFATAVLAALSIPLARNARRRELVAALIPFATIPLLYGYFILTDSMANIWGQMAPATGNVILGKLVTLLLNGRWEALATLTAEFLQTHVWHLAHWIGVAACLAAPAVVPSRLSCGARFFAGIYLLFLAVHFLFLKHFVLSYRVIYEATFYMALAFLVEAIVVRLGAVSKNAARFLRVAAVAVLVLLTLGAMTRFRERLWGRQLPYARLQGALTYALLEAGARPGDRVFVPTPFAFHLQRRFDVVAYPAPGRYFYGRWSQDFRQGVRHIWGTETLAQEDSRSLCWAMGLAYVQPDWVMSWNWDSSVLRPFRKFLQRFPDVPGIQLTQIRRVDLPPPYGGKVRVYRLGLSDAMRALDRSAYSSTPPCP